MKIIIGIFDRILMKLKRIYWKNLLSYQIGQKLENCTVLGRVEVYAINVKIGKNVTFYPGTMLWGDGVISIGDNVDIGKNTILYAKMGGGIVIGDNTSIAAQCFIIDSDHKVEKNILIQKQGMSTEKITIGKDVWIAANCTILKGAIISDGAVIGAKSLVKGFCEKDMIYVGIPAKKLKQR